MLPRPIKNQPSYAERLDAIRAAAAPTLAKVDAGDFTWRDVAVLVEYLSQFGDVLDEMIVTPPPIVSAISEQAVERIADYMETQ